MNIIKRETTRRLFLTTFFFVYLLLTIPLLARAQSANTLPIAQTISVADPEVAYGDIILYDPETNLFRRSEGVNDPRVYGVVVEDPALLIETDASLVPVAESGRLPVNVTLENGDIEEGDALVTSSIPGKAMRADPNQENIIGFAVEGLTEAEGIKTTLEDGSSAILGTITVEVGRKRLQETSTNKIDETEKDKAEKLAFGSGKAIARFGFAAVVALGSIALTFIAFLSSIKQGVISVGRNPLAKSSIRSMIILNVVLALVVATIGVFFAISLLIVPL